MKVLILAGLCNVKKAEKIKSLCRQSGAQSSIYWENKKSEIGLSTALNKNDLIIIIWDHESNNNKKIIFSTGYCVGKNKSFVLYVDNKQTAPECRGKEIIISKPDELKEYIIAEVKNYWKQRALEAAKSKIMDMGLELSLRELIEVVSEGESIALEQFLKAGFSPDSCDKNSVSLLNIAIRKGHPNIAAALINNGADINSISGDRGNTPLMDAAAEGNMEILFKLIESGSDLDFKSKSGQTALILSVGRKSEEAAIALISAGADIDIKDNLGMSARKYAELFRLDQVLSLINKGNP